MPIYEYECRKCGKILEILHASSETASHCGDECQQDGAPGDGPLVRLISRPALRTASHDLAKDKIDYDKAAKKGFTTFKRAGKGEYERIAGDKGPQRIIAKD